MFLGVVGLPSINHITAIFVTVIVKVIVAGTREPTGHVSQQLPDQVHK